MVFALSVLKVLPLLKAFTGNTFAIHRKFPKTVKLFSHVHSLQNVTAHCKNEVCIPHQMVC